MAISLPVTTSLFPVPAGNPATDDLPIHDIAPDVPVTSKAKKKKKKTAPAKSSGAGVAVIVVLLLLFGGRGR